MTDKNRELSLASDAQSATIGPTSEGSLAVFIDGWETGDIESVSGVGFDIEAITSSDEHNIIDKPGRFKARDLILTRRFKKDDVLNLWIGQLKSGHPVKRSGWIKLFGSNGEEALRIDIRDAWPKSWSGPQLAKDMQGGTVLSETITLSVADIEIQ